MTDERQAGLREAAQALSRKVDWFLDRNIYRAYPFEDEARALRAALDAQVPAQEERTGIDDLDPERLWSDLTEAEQARVVAWLSEARPVPAQEERLDEHDCPQLNQLRAAVEFMDQKVTPYGNRADGTVQHYLVGDSTWHRVLAAARRSTRDAKLILVSCLACGRSAPLASWHRDRPDIGICEYCRDARRTLQAIASEDPSDPERGRAAIQLAQAETRRQP